MPQQLALLICVLFILFLFDRDRRSRPFESWSLWIPMLWVFLLGSRPVSSWLGAGIEGQMLEDYLEGSPLDRVVFSTLIGLGILVLLRRKVDWARIFESNKWFLAFFLYCGMSVIWSDYSLTAFKRYVKEVGNVVMAIIILTEHDPVKAMKAILARYSYLAVPLSVLFIKYYPSLGRYYDRWIWEPIYCGISTGKNGLGAVVMIAGVFLICDLMDMLSEGFRKADKVDVSCRIVLIGMVFYLFSLAKSSTSLVCLIIGVVLYLLLRFTPAREQVRYLGTYGLVIGTFSLFLYYYQGILEAVVGLVGRNLTLTGRTDIWGVLVSRETSVLSLFFGAGFESYWLTDFGTARKLGFYYLLNQAHNGYLETYLQLGLVGLFLLVAVIVATGAKLKWDILEGSAHGMLLLSYFVIVIFYNWTEAIFNKLSLVWMMLILCALNHADLPGSITGGTVHDDMDTK